MLYHRTILLLIFVLVCFTCSNNDRAVELAGWTLTVNSAIYNLQFSTLPWRHPAVVAVENHVGDQPDLQYLTFCILPQRHYTSLGHLNGTQHFTTYRTTFEKENGYCISHYKRVSLRPSQRTNQIYQAPRNTLLCSVKSAMFALGGHGLLVGGSGSSLRRDDVAVVSIHQEGVLGDAVPAMGHGISPGEQFDRSLRDVFNDKNKVELVLRMNTNEDISTAQAFTQNVFDTRRLRQWKRLVEERHWKSISFSRSVVHEDMGLVHFPVEMLDGPPPAQQRGEEEEEEDVIMQDQEAQEQLPRNQMPPISQEEERIMWRGLIEPCRYHTQRLELRGEMTAVQAQVVSSVFVRPVAAAAAVARLSTSMTTTSRLRVLCLTDIQVTTQVAVLLGEIIHGDASPSCLKELSLSKCLIEQGVWSSLLGSAPLDDSDRSDLDEDVATMEIPQQNVHVLSNSEGSMSVAFDIGKESKPGGKASSTPPSSSLSSSPAPPHVLPPLHALYLSDCDLGRSDVHEILSSLRGHPLLRTLYLNGQQSFRPAQVDSTLIDHLQKNPNIEQIQLPSRNQHNPQIYLYAELNRCGRRLLRARRDADHGVGPPAPIGLWPLVLERIRRVPGLTPSRHANAMYYFVKELHGISTSGGSGGTRPPKKTSSITTKGDFILSHKSASTTTSSTSAMSSLGSRESCDHCDESRDGSVHLAMQQSHP